MARPFEQLRDRMSPEARERVDERVRETLFEMNLQELRQRVAGITQTDLAELMKVTQGAISQLEKRHDVLLRKRAARRDFSGSRPAPRRGAATLLSKLAEYIHALGGNLELIARFPDGEVRITQFDAEKTRAAANE